MVKQEQLESLDTGLKRFLSHQGVPTAWLSLINLVILSVILLTVIIISDYLTKAVLSKTMNKLAHKTSTKFDDHLMNNGFVKYIAHLVPFGIANLFLPLITTGLQTFNELPGQLLNCYGLILGVQIVRSVLFSVRDELKNNKDFRDKPIESYVQVLIIICYFIAGLLMFTYLTGKSILAFFTTLGAASAVILLLFKDTLLGFVASIQVSINDMVRIGDWITMDKYGADGDVVEINLTTVKVQNFDKTITTIPTYNLISDSFKNWRGMQASGGRRIKRSLNIQLSTIKHLTEDDITALSKIRLLQPHLLAKLKELESDNTKNDFVNEASPLNGRRLTNIGVFRLYAELYLKQHPHLHKDKTLMVRQLSPGPQGLPIEIYTFTLETDWQIYEERMADIFDHLIASVPSFGLQIHEMPTDFCLPKFSQSNTLTTN